MTYNGILVEVVLMPSALRPVINLPVRRLKLYIMKGLKGKVVYLPRKRVRGTLNKSNVRRSLFLSLKTAADGSPAGGNWSNYVCPFRCFQEDGSYNVHSFLVRPGKAFFFFI